MIRKDQVSASRFNKMKIALIGRGAMGKLVASLAENNGHEISAVIGRDAASSVENLAGLLRGSDAAVDFSVTPSVRRNVEACMLADVPLVEGTTGWNDQREAVASVVRVHGGGMVCGANFSISVNLFYRIARYSSELTAKVGGYEAFIEEQHHSRKKDAPSGTALKLKSIVSISFPDELSVVATRAGNIPGTHRVGFDGPADQILLEHTARSREGFAAGALMAAEWIVGKKGFFEFSDIFDDIVG